MLTRRSSVRSALPALLTQSRAQRGEKPKAGACRRVPGGMRSCQIHYEPVSQEVLKERRCRPTAPLKKKEKE